MVNTPTVNTPSPDQGENGQSTSYAFYFALSAIVTGSIALAIVMFILFRAGSLTNPAQVTTVLATYFTLVGTVAGAYFGIKSSRDATREIDKVADASGAYVERLTHTEPDDILAIAGTQTEILTGYYTTALAQANQSFRWALVVGLFGLAFFFGAVAFLLTTQVQSIATVSVIGGALVEVISGILFYLYGKATIQLADFQQRLAQTQRFLLANAICESLEGEEKQKARSSLVHTIADPNSSQ
jgi:hypothetical protein